MLKVLMCYCLGFSCSRLFGCFLVLHLSLISVIKWTNCVLTILRLQFLL
uniref:Uncharacterized protein n=1 Tax=Rhizophora mucronata TaxID=61149 RepID=A0A2P2QNR4_RHIMU